MPDAGLELFISGTHWLDAWEGDWDDHMRRLARDVADLTAGVSRRSPPVRPGSVARSALSMRLRRSCSRRQRAGLPCGPSSGSAAETPPSETNAPPVRNDRRVSPSISPSATGRGGHAIVGSGGSALRIVRRSRSGPGSAAARDARAQSTQNGQVTGGVRQSSTRVGAAADGQPSAQTDSRAGSFRRPTQRRTGRVAR